MIWRIAFSVLAAGVLAAGAGTAEQAPSQEAPTVWSGIYTDAQAQRGQATYLEFCSYCHMDTLAGFGGDTAAAALTGARFFVRWRNESVGEMFRIISETMPETMPGSLTPQVYLDIISYVFKVNRIPAGEAELVPDREKLGRTIFTDRPKP